MGVVGGVAIGIFTTTTHTSALSLFTTFPVRLLFAFLMRDIQAYFKTATT